VRPAPDTPVFMIGVAARLAGMHPQTLRMWERRGLLSPSRTARNTRLYSEADVELLRRIQLLSEAGLNLTGIERVLDLERQLAVARRRLAAAEAELTKTAAAARAELEELRRSLRGELVVAPRGESALAHRYRRVVDPAS
jgi:MerR family transcriptional regulator/heat shock protein HspR